MNKPDFSKSEILLCFYRSICVSVFLLLAFALIHIIGNAIMITSLAASAFIVFAFPKAHAVLPRFILGGYFCASLWGAIAALIYNAIEPSFTAMLLVCITVAFLTTFCMTLFNFEHPPAVAFAISLVFVQNPITMAVLSLLIVSALCIIKKPLASIMLKLSGKSKEGDEK